MPIRTATPNRSPWETASVSGASDPNDPNGGGAPAETGAPVGDPVDATAMRIDSMRIRNTHRVTEFGVEHLYRQR